ncbi:hypothetical protein JTE90_004687 [Oedothorax gibbosus]|uniref:Uncharacterized protein n=1 Tax=Oedothorax gibbosus TaxID=931172 RepID=A0AAV6UA45_9ARAC|nr:hypothetical protein JTE90_004687 [Oedothorax gibbosus]
MVKSTASEKSHKFDIYVQLRSRGENHRSIFNPNAAAANKSNSFRICIFSIHQNSRQNSIYERTFPFGNVSLERDGPEHSKDNLNCPKSRFRRRLGLRGLKSQ